MARATTVVTRVATTSDLPELRTLLAEWATVGGRLERAVNPTVMDDLADQLPDVLDGDRVTILVASADGNLRGMAVVGVVPINLLSKDEMAQLSHLVVAPGSRNHGIGRALVAAAAEWAEQKGLDSLVSHVYPSLREANRFYARLGFAPVVIRRVAPVASLRRRLAVLDRVDVLGETAARRRMLRRPRRAAADVALGERRPLATRGAVPPA